MGQAIDCYKQALVIADEMGDIDRVARHSCHLARFYAQSGQLDQALSLAQQAAGIWGQIGSPNVQVARDMISKLQSMLRQYGGGEALTER